MPLFSTHDLHATLRDIVDRKAKESVDAIPVEQFNGSTEEQLVAHISDSLRLEPLQLHTDQMTQDTREVKLDFTPRVHAQWGNFSHHDPIQQVDGLRLTVEIPFSGNPGLWEHKPSQFFLGGIQVNGTVRGNTLILTFQNRAEQAKELAKECTGAIERIQTYLENQRQQIEGHFRPLPQTIRNAIAKRKSVLAAKAQLSTILNIPLKTQPGVPQVVPMKRKLPVPLPSAKPSEERFDIGEEHYQHILGVIRHEGRTFERTPATFAIHGEEALRNILLAHLNGHYQGDATGEAFRNKGKTDICVEFKNRAAFVGECKNWGGAKVATDALSQLLNYTTWRDVKTSLILFNMDVRGFADIQGKMKELLEGHPLFVRHLECAESGEWRIQCKHPADETRQMTVHVFLFDLYADRTR